HPFQKEGEQSTIDSLTFNRLYTANQQQKITFNLDRASFTEALDAVARKANVGISYEPAQLPDKTVTYRCRNKEVFKVLEDILYGTLLTYRLSADKEVIIIRKKDSVQTGSIT